MLFIAMLLAAQSPAAAASAVPKPEDKIVCRREDSVNSRIRTKKVCLKQSEWDRISREAQEEIKRSANQKSIPNNPVQ